MLLNHATEYFQHNPTFCTAGIYSQIDTTKKFVWQNIMWEEKHAMWFRRGGADAISSLTDFMGQHRRVGSNYDVTLMEDTVLQNKEATLETDLSPADENTYRITMRSKEHSSSKS
jgi:hypothetical protein